MVTNSASINTSCSSTCNIVRCWKWDVRQVINRTSPCIKYAVLILNRPITQNVHFFRDFWNYATVRITIDGGTRQFNTFLKSLPTNMQEQMKKPDLVTGDFDSISEEILQEYKKKGCKIISTPDQNHTDFTKALVELNKYCLDHQIELGHVVAVGQSSGRLDQILGNIQTLFLNRERYLLHPNTKLYILTDDALSWLLSPGNHVICIPEEMMTQKKPWCSLIPIGEACERVSTTGLKWNLVKQTLRFGEVVSTSNTFSGSDTVTVKCSHALLWSMKIPSIINK